MSLHLVTGAGGQDGILLTRLLQSLGHDVVAATRSGAPVSGHTGPVVALDVRDTSAYIALIRSHRPDVVHHLAGLSSVGESWKDPVTTRAVNEGAVSALLAGIAGLGASGPRFVHASSSEIFGAVPGGAASPQTPLAPINPYGEAKAAAHTAVQEARSLGLSATNLILFGHTSPLQTPTFVLPTIVQQAVDVARGQRSMISLRDPSIARDWGSAHDHVRAFAAAAAGRAGDYVVATGRLHRLADVAAWALEAAGASTALVSDETSSGRPHDYGGVLGDISLTTEVLGWRPKRPLRREIESMVTARLAAPDHA